MPLHIKGRSFLISTFSCTCLGNVGFHEMQDPPPPLWVTTNCHIQSIKTNTITKAVHNIQSRLENKKLGHRKVQTLIEIGEDACGSKSSSALLT